MDKNQKITLLIADDEATIRNGLSTVVPWEEFGITIVGTARDGREALEIMRSCRPDIVITDIRMPEIDGLELIGIAKKEKLDTNFMILSGYDDFQYAQKAIGLGVKYYFLKPIKIAELVTELRKLKEVIRQTNHIKSYSAYLDVKSDPKEKFLKQLVKNEFHSREEIDEEIQKLGLPLSKSPYRVIVFSISNDEEHETEDEFSQIKYLLDIVQDELKETRHEVLIWSSRQLLAIVHTRKEDGSLVDYTFLSGKCINRGKRHGKLSVLAGIGGENTSLMECANSYKQALLSLSYSFYQPELEIFDEQIICTEKPEKGPDAIDYNHLFYLITMNRKDEIKFFCQDYFRQLQYVPMPPPSYIKGMCIYLVTDIQKELSSRQKEGQELPRADVIVQIQETATLAELKQLIEIFLLDCTDMLLSKEHLSSNQTIKAAEYYIKSHISEKILAKDVARHVNLSDVYFTSYFKLKTGINFRDYVIQIKMEYAKTLMEQHPDQTVSEVGTAIGYDDYRSFYRVFKQYTGVNPSDYLKCMEQET